MLVESSATKAWMRAAETVGVELPEEVATAFARLASVKAQTEALPKPVEPPKAPDLVAEGMPLDEAQAEVARLTAEETKKAEARKIVRSGLELARANANRAVDHGGGEALILNLRPVVDALVENARPLASQLQEFAPKYDAGSIVRRANTKQIAAWRKAEELEGIFGDCMAAWRGQFKAGTKEIRSTGFDVRWVEQVHYYWERPEYVGNPRLNGTHLTGHGYPIAIQPTLLGVASEPEEAGFRLISRGELAEVYQATQMAKVKAERERVASFRRDRSGRGMAV